MTDPVHKMWIVHDTTTIPKVVCTCGWSYKHVRSQVRNAQGAIHHKKTGHTWTRDGLPPNTYKP